MADATEGHVSKGRAPGTTDGTATVVETLAGHSTSRGGRPGASTVLDEPSAKIVAFEFAEGDELHEHAAHHPVLIEVRRGRAELVVPDRTIDLRPGMVLHLTALLRHSVRALEPTTLTVTMLLPQR